MVNVTYEYVHYYGLNTVPCIGLYVQVRMVIVQGGTFDDRPIQSFWLLHFYLFSCAYIYT